MPFSQSGWSLILIAASLLRVPGVAYDIHTRKAGDSQTRMPAMADVLINGRSVMPEASESPHEFT
jgi:hypothetical protein